MTKQLQVLYDEHRSIAAVLDAFTHLLRDSERGKPVDPDVFRQMLYYLDVATLRGGRHPSVNPLERRGARSLVTLLH